MIEDLKNGRYFSTKYVSEMRIYKPPHVVCFANSEPNFAALSADRWVCCDLTKDALDACLHSLFPKAETPIGDIQMLAADNVNYYGSPLAGVLQSEEEYEEDNQSEDSLALFETQPSPGGTYEDPDAIPPSGRPAEDVGRYEKEKGEASFEIVGRRYSDCGEDFCVIKGTDSQYIDEFYSVFNLK